MAFCFTESEKKSKNFYETTKDPQIDKAIFRKKNKAEGITFPHFEIYYKATVIKTVWYCHKDRHIDQQNKIESPEIGSNIYTQLIFDKGAKNTQRGKGSLFSKWCWENWMSTCKRMKLNSYTIHKNQLKMN